jgi:hypothetical protein
MIALIFLLFFLAINGNAQQPSIRIIDEKPFFIHLEPNQRRVIHIPNEAWIEPDNYCWKDGNVIRDEYTVGKSNALAYGETTISAGFRFPVNVKITKFRIEIKP